LLFLTSRQALAENVGQTETDYLLEAIRGAGMLLYDTVPPRLQEASQAMDWVRPHLRSNPTIEGVVLLGGDDVLPAQRLDALDPGLRSSLSSRSDPDNFIVWSDDIYGDRDGDGLPELPVSRIPDGKASRFLFAAIKAGDRPVGSPRNGVRNVKRPFAEGIYQNLPGAGTMLVSEPTTSNQIPPSTWPRIGCTSCCTGAMRAVPASGVKPPTVERSRPSTSVTCLTAEGGWCSRGVAGVLSP
jgi:hypothetical protein